MIELNCCCGALLFSARPAQGRDVAKFRSAWKSLVARSQLLYTCQDCSSEFQLVDDELPIKSGGCVTLKNISKPSITGINNTFGPMDGGNAVTITGSELDVGTLTVKFGAVASPSIISRTKTTAVVEVPEGSLKLNGAELLTCVSGDVVSGSISRNDVVTADDGSTGIVRHVNAEDYSIIFQSLTTSVDGLVGQQLSGSTGGKLNITTVRPCKFAPREQVVGLKLGSTANVKYLEDHTLVVDSPSGPFAINESVVGQSTGDTMILTGSPAFDSTVDVTVENSYGIRTVGSALVRAYTYK